MIRMLTIGLFAAQVGMAFDQGAATHHFRLTTAGGFIQVEANDPADSTTRDAIRAHLRTIATQFAGGDFSAPFVTHGEVPPGVPTMRTLKSDIAYSFESTGKGGRVRISTTNGAALAAIHEFLRYQIREHATDDPTEPGGSTRDNR